LSPRASLTVDVAICTRDRPDELRSCLESVYAQTFRPQTILVVNGGGPLDDHGEGVSVVASTANLPRQRNVALSRSTSDLIAFLDDDVELEPTYLQQIVDWFDTHADCVGAGGHIVNDRPFSRGSILCRRAFNLGTGDGKLRASGDALYLYHPVCPTLVDYLSGSNMAWRRKRIEGLRFDENLHGYGYMEDIDFSLAAARRGELWVVPAARLLHAKTETARVPPRAYVRQVFENGAYLFAKHRRSQGLSGFAYAWRMTGRTAAYTASAVRNRSLDLLLGVASGLRATRRMMQAGRIHERV
jgi:GT2 family glycosyltransferase